MSQHLLIIDPQNDFCDIPGAALPVTGADADMRRLAALIREPDAQIDAITVTLDSHQRLDIAHPGFWQKGTSAQGESPSPFTQITAAQIRSGEFVPRDANALPRALAYAEALEAQGRYTLMIWPVHCEIGTWGHNVHAELHAALVGWQLAHQRNISYVIKGTNPWTEHYSALQAEVPDDDPGTQLNRSLIEALKGFDHVLVAGEASSHCVKATVEHLVEHLKPAQLTLLRECMSPVGGFEAQAANFLADMQKRGVVLA
ncbi:MAG TPA: cysteine hydrolase [Burkholderiaceae bacterium]|jgi:nicotinamidase-related amidase